MPLQIYKSKTNLTVDVIESYFSAAKKMDYKRKLFLLILSATLLRIVAASFTELGNDEAYYWTYAQHLQWSYFDHPPLVGIWIRFFTANLVLENFELLIRLGSIISCAISTVIIFKLLKELTSERAGFIAACLYTTSLYASISAGTFILPDSPQLLFWSSSLYFIMKILKAPSAFKYWVLFAVTAGLAIMSKVHGAFIWVGFLLFIIIRQQKLLRSIHLYTAFVISFIITSPILFWNISNDFASFNFQTSRLSSSSSLINWSGLLQEIYGQILFTNPINFLVIITALLATMKSKHSTFEAHQVYSYIALPMIIIFLLTSAVGNTLPHWSGPAYITLIPLTASYLDKKYSLVFPNAIKWSIGLLVFTMTAGIMIIKFYPGTFGKQNATTKGTGDPSLDMYGWKEGAEAFKKIYQQENLTQSTNKKAPLVFTRWYPAGHVDYYFARTNNIPVIGIGDKMQIHHYHWLNQFRMAIVDMEKAYTIIPSNERFDVNVFDEYYNRIDLITSIPIYRNGTICKYFYIYRLTGLNRN